MKTRSRVFRRLWLAGLAGLAVALTGAGFVFNLSRAGGTPADATSGDPGRTAPEVVCFGHVDMENGVSSLYPVLPGRVMKIEARENQAVKAGAVLLRLDDAVPAARVREAEADVDAAKEQVNQALKLPEQHRIKAQQQKAAIDAVQHRLSAARHAQSRKQELVRIQQLSEKEADAAADLVKELEAVEAAEAAKLKELELDDPQTGIARARADLKAKEARLDQARRGVEECQLKAPTDGLVLRVLVGPGDVLGSQPKQPAILFCPAGERIIRAEVEQEFAPHVATGQPATVQDDSRAGLSWRGKVMRVSDWYTHRRSILQEPLQFNDVRTLECLIQLDPGQPALRIGQRVRVQIGASAVETARR